MLPTGMPFGQKPRQLVEQLKDILDRYPDGGQILKEIIQNADDGGATKVFFFYDHKTYETSTLLHPALAAFQGPSLLAYNNAVFKPEDWTNIENLGRSYKKSDPLKVGRFGLGFNAVYHLTDLPMILSGDRFGVFEPHEKLFQFDGKVTAGTAWKLDELTQHQDQFSPFIEMVRQMSGVDVGTTEFNGTIFRFPLRVEPSELSNTIYDEQRMDQLFDDFECESKDILLFLNNVMNLKVLSSSKSIDISANFKDAKSKTEKKLFAEARERTKIEGGKLVLASDEPTVHSWDTIITVKKKSTLKSQTACKITAYIPGKDNAHKEILELSPVITSFPQITVSSNLSEPSGFDGRVFCCLPLPFGAIAGLTGLPIHVNGSFGLSDNRRDLKWTGLDQKHDIGAKWNEALIRHVLPFAYRHHLNDLIDSGTSSDKIYNTLPDPERTKKNWKPLVEPFYMQLLNESSIFWTEAKGGSWISASEAIFMQEDYDLKSNKCCDTARSFLAKLGVKTVEIPATFMKSIKSYSKKKKMLTAGPDVVREKAASHSNFLENQLREHKLHLLEYCLSDEKYWSMTSLPLVPLTGGSFCRFEMATENSRPVFIDSVQHPRILLPNLQHWFLDDTVSSRIKNHLVKAASLKYHQLRMLGPTDIATYLKDALPKKWFKSGLSSILWEPGSESHPSLEWLSTLWPYLNRHFPDKLDDFRSLPIVPVSLSPTPTLGFLSANFGIVFRQRGGASLPDLISNSLEADFNCHVIKSAPKYLDHSDLDRYLYWPTAEKVLHNLEHYQSKNLIQKMSEFSVELKDEWCKFLAQLSSDSCRGHEAFIRSIPIFRVCVGTDTSIEIHSNIEDTEICIEPTPSEIGWLPGGIRLPNKIISRQTNPASATLANRLGCRTLTMEELLAKLIANDFFGKLTKEEMEDLSLWILQKSRFYIFRGLHRRLRALRFVQNGTELKAPCELFDPNQEQLQDLFIGESVFPTNPFSDPTILVTLRELGLKTEPSFSDVLRIIDILNRNVNRLNLEDVQKKSDSIVYWLEKLSAWNLILDCEVPRLRNSSFLFVQQERPKCYPPSLQWGGVAFGRYLASPDQCWSRNEIFLVASTLPVANYPRQISEELSKLFGWDSPSLEKIEKIAEHLKNLSLIELTECHKSTVERMSKSIYKFANSLKPTYLKKILEKFNTFNWIWIGDRFFPPQRIILDSGNPDLRPYIMTISYDFEIFQRIFSDGGAHKTVCKDLLVKVLKEIKQFNSSSTEHWKRDLAIVISILNWISGSKVKTDELLVPIKTDQERLILEPITRCSYFDSEFNGHLDFPEGEERVHILHHDVSKNLALSLGIPSLTNTLINANEFGFVPFGQSEPLTQRIKNILDEYPDEIGIFKEMIQNADDAGATQVSFVFDWRENKVISSSGLLDPGMAACNGSALWAYNNAMFSKEDFANIERLGGQTKKDVVEKIGRFGIGFNSVYHLTDVPSFVSGSYIAFFDPYMTHLNDRISNKLKPGLKIQFTGNKNVQKLYANQLKPYDGLFGCNISSSPEPFEGTLFRLPFRKTLQKGPSSNLMSTKLYNDTSKVYRLLKDLTQSECADILLLFTQNVLKVNIYEIPYNAIYSRAAMREILEVQKTPVKILRNIVTSKTSDLNNQTKMLSMAKIFVTQPKISTASNISSVLLTVQTKVSGVKEESNWLVTNAVGTGEALQMARSEDGKAQGLMPCGGVAAKLNKNWIPEKVTGQISCFLPLSILSGLPVHVNGAFAVASNRKSLWRVSAHDPNNWRGKWNERLMADPIRSAYVTLMEDLTSICSKDILKENLEIWLKGYRSIFPIITNPSKTNEVDHLVHATYNLVQQMARRIFPVLRLREKQVIEVQWFPTMSGDPASNAYFDQSSTANIRGILVELGFNLVHSSFTDLVSSLSLANLKVLTVGPSSVKQFLLNCSLKRSLPRELHKTQIQNAETLSKLLKYCLKEEGKIDGLPLLLTNDNILRVFEKRIFNPNFCDLVPRRQDQFLSVSMVSTLLGETDLFVDMTLSDLTMMKKDFEPIMSNPAWILKFWEFLAAKIASKSLTVHDVSSTIPHWRVFPATRQLKNEFALFSFQNVKDVIHLPVSTSERENRMAKILRSLFCWEPDFGPLQKDQQVRRDGLTSLLPLAAKFTSHLRDYNGLCRILSTVRFESQLSIDELESILEYFESEASSLSQNSLNQLKSINIFETIDKRRVKTFGCNVYVINGDIPSEGIKGWISKSGNLFLRPQPTLKNLFKRFEFRDISLLSAYQSFICDNLKNMDETDRLEHLQFLQNQLTLTSKNNTEILAKLATLPIVLVDGRLSTVSEFYDSTNILFKRLVAVTRLLPAKYSNLIQLFKQIGLKIELTNQMFLDIARDIERCKDDRGSLLMNLLPKNPSFLEELSRIKFIEPHRIDESMLNLHPQFGGGDFVCFNESVVPSYKNVVWTCAAILPQWAATKDFELLQDLGVIQEPSIEMVVKHCATLCNHLAENKIAERTGEANSDQSCKALTDVMRNIYRFLNDRVNQKEALACLKEVSFVLVEEGRKLVLPKQVSKMMRNDLRPHLYKFPMVMGEFEALFVLLGTTEEPNVSQYSNVLEKIFAESSGRPLNPEEKRVALQAIVSYLEAFKVESKKPGFGTAPFFLLSKSFVLKRSNLMKFNDVPKLSGRLSQLENECEESEFLGLDLKLLKLLPIHLKPTFMSEIVLEKLDNRKVESCKNLGTFCRVKSKFESLLQDHFFSEGLIRLSKHVCSKKNVEYADNEMTKRLNKIKSINFECRASIKTVLAYRKDQQVIPGSERELGFHVNDEGSFLIHHKKVHHFEISQLIAKKIEDILQNYADPECSQVIHRILNLDDNLGENSSSIPTILDESNISRAPCRWSQIPGDIIEDQFKIFLQQNPDHYFRENEMVGYEDDDNATCILAQVVSEVKSKTIGGSNMARKYLINVGKTHPIEVSALDLFKFIRCDEPEAEVEPEVEEVVNALVVLNLPDDRPWSRTSQAPKNERAQNTREKPKEPPRGSNNAKIEDLPKTLEEAKKEIDRMLVEAWKLPERDRTKAIKRLFLRWHPDKNLGQEELCTEAFKHLQNQISSLEKTGTLGAGSKNGAGFSSRPPGPSFDGDFFRSNFEEFFRRWESDARFYGHHNQNWQRSRRSSSQWGGGSNGFNFGGSGANGFSESRASNPDEAKRWFKESKSDLQNAQAASVKTSANSVCFAAQQSAEKAMKAIIFFINGQNPKSHQLVFLAGQIENFANPTHKQILRGIAVLAEELATVGLRWRDGSDNLYERAKCPNAHKSPNLPSTVFTATDAEKAKTLALKIVQIAENLLA